MEVRETDLTAYARIRNAALDGFATRGVAATSIRDVADAAGVSAGLVQHHFGTKAGLQEAVDEYVASVAAEMFSDIDALAAADPLRELGDRITELVRTYPNALLYVARSAAEGGEASLGLFDGLVDLAKAQWAQLADDGRLHEDADVEWAALHIVIFNLGTVMFESALSRSLGKPFTSPEELQRWNRVTTDLFERGLLRPPG